MVPPTLGPTVALISFRRTDPLTWAWIGHLTKVPTFSLTWVATFRLISVPT